MVEEYVSKGAVISSCGLYRYHLWREWRLHPKPALWDMWTEDDGSPVLDGVGEQLGEPKFVLFVMLNPSTADGSEDDATISRCVAFAKAWGYDRMEVVNLFAYRATSPADMLKLSHDVDPVGYRNEHFFGTAAYDADKIVCAWGNHGSHLGQDQTALGWLDAYRSNAEICCLKLTGRGQPSHPLYLKSDLVPFALPSLTPGAAK